MSADLTTSAWLVDGTDLAVAGVELLHDGSGLWDGLSEDATPDLPPGFDGGVDVGGAFRPYTRPVMYEVTAADPKAAWAAVVAFRRRCKPGRSITLTRRMPDPEGTDANVDVATTARRLGDRIAWNGKNNRLTIDTDWQITGGPFFGASVNIASAAGVQAIKGDARTRRMTITLPAGAARYLTNTTNGFSLTFSAAVPAGGVLIDVEALTAHAITGGADMSEFLSWNKIRPFQLEAGANTIVVSAVSASIDYQPAYL